jgi:Zn finger protein HypA/HybF involved in hydrogenase expression
MSWWSDLLRRLTGEQQDESVDEVERSSTFDGPPVFECQTCFKVFDSDRQRPTCPECDSADVKTLTS